MFGQHSGVIDVNKNRMSYQDFQLMKIRGFKRFEFNIDLLPLEYKSNT